MKYTHINNNVMYILYLVIKKLTKLKVKLRSITMELISTYLKIIYYLNKLHIIINPFF